MRKIRFAIALIIFYSLNLFAQEKVIKEEYSVYSKVFEIIYKQNFKPQSKAHFMILENTHSPSSQLENFLKHKNYSDYLYKTNPQKEMSAQKMEELLSDFKKVNHYSTKLKRKFSMNHEYSLITQSEVDQLLEKGKRENQDILNKQEYLLLANVIIWKTFLNKYPNSGGCYYLSRAGFSSDKKLAMVFIRLERGSFGMSTYYIVEKINKEWGNPKMFAYGRAD